MWWVLKLTSTLFTLFIFLSKALLNHIDNAIDLSGKTLYIA